MTLLTELLDPTATEDHVVDASHVDPHVAQLRKQLAEAIQQRNLYRFQCEQNKATIEGQADEIRQLRALVAKQRVVQ